MRTNKDALLYDPSMRNPILKAFSLCSLFVFANGGAAAIATDRFSTEIEPLLEAYCVKCHGPEEQESNLRIDTLDRDFVNGRDGESWHDMLDVLILEDMPPEDEDQPSVTERAAIVEWITDKLTQASEIRRSTGGQGVVRRLTRYEYNNTLTDLLGVELDYAKDLPPESSSHDGFLNNGSVMGMSSMQLEFYLKAAQRGLSIALVEGAAPYQYRHWSTENVARREAWVLDEPHTRNIQPGNAFMSRILEYPTEGAVTIRVKAHAVIPEGKGPPRMRVRIGVLADTYIPGSQVGQDIDVWETATESGVYEFRGRLEEFPVLTTPTPHPGLVITVQNTYDDGSDAIEIIDLRLNEQQRELNTPDPEQPWLVVERVEFVAPDYAVWPPRHHQDILGLGQVTAAEEEERARESIAKFMKRAFRRPPASKEVDEVYAFYNESRQSYPTHIQAMRQALSMVLVSPQFLYLMEPKGAKPGFRKLTPHEVASRLSYFLWSTMPDDRLIELADNGRLLKNNVLKKEIRRMLDAPKSKRFVEQFADQWLDLGALDRVAVNPQFYPDFNDRVKPDMRKESIAFFEEVLRENLSALNFLDSDFAMLNERLAKHYGIEGVVGTEMSRAALKPEHRRGGLITQASMLVGNSTGEDSHPIDRAVWILDRLLDDPPAPPPASVPDLDPETPGFAQLSLKEQLEIHRDTEGCVSCHRKIDPWGIPLEHFDATGLYRTEVLRLTAEEKGQARNQSEWAPLDAEDVMPDGHEINGADQLKAYLLEERKDDFARALVVKIAAYALGRSIEFTDEPIIDRLTAQFADNDYRLDFLITSIVSSELFLTR